MKRAEFASRTICFLFTSDLTRRSPRRQLCSQFGIMSHVFGSRSTICQYKGVTRGVSAYQFGGGAACYPKYTKSFGDARSAFAFLPSSCHPPVLPKSSVLFRHPRFIPLLPPAPARPGYNARQIDDSIEYRRIHCVARCIRWAKDQFKRIMEIDQTSWISCT